MLFGVHTANQKQEEAHSVNFIKGKGRSLVDKDTKEGSTKSEGKDTSSVPNWFMAPRGKRGGGGGEGTGKGAKEAIEGKKKFEGMCEHWGKEAKAMEQGTLRTFGTLSVRRAESEKEKYRLRKTRKETKKGVHALGILNLNLHQRMKEQLH